MADADPSELDQLRRDNARLIGLLETHGIPWRSSGLAPDVDALRWLRDRPRSGRHNGCAFLDPAHGTSRPATGPSAG